MYNFKNKDEAVHYMVETFNRIPTYVLEPSICLGEYRVEERSEDDDGNYYYEDDTYNVPMWGWCWDISDYISYEEIEDYYFKYKLLDLGFTIIKDENGGNYWIGINGAGFNFYDAFWTPLYDVLGFKWHEVNIFNKDTESALRNIKIFLLENEEYGDNWSKEIKCLDKLLTHCSQ